MVEITCTGAKRSRYITRDSLYNREVNDRGEVTSSIVKAGFEDLAMAFKRNRVQLDFKCDGVGQNYYNMPVEFGDISNKIADYCDRNCTGFWTWNYRYKSLSEYDLVTQSHKYTDKGKVDMTVQFENEADIEPFLKNCAVLLRLAH